MGRPILGESVQRFLILILVFIINNAFAKSHFNKVIEIIFENTSFESAQKNDYLKSLSKEGVLFTNFKAITHPSLPNYVSKIAGSTLLIKNDDDYNLSEIHLGDLLENKKLDWRVYAEDFPGNCSLVSRKNKYVRKHIPFLSFTNVTSNPNRCKKIKDLSDFYQDYKNKQLVDYSMIVPNLDNDGHDTGIKFAMEWFKKNFDTYINGSGLPNDLLFIITFDEGMGKGNSIYTLLLGNMVKKDVEIKDELNHFSILKLIEDNFSLTTLHREDEKARPIPDIWKN